MCFFINFAEFQDKYSQINERMNSKDDDQKQNTNFDESFSTDTECSLGKQTT